MITSPVMEIETIERDISNGLDRTIQPDRVIVRTKLLYFEGYLCLAKENIAHPNKELVVILDSVLVKLTCPHLGLCSRDFIFRITGFQICHDLANRQLQ